MAVNRLPQDRQDQPAESYLNLLSILFIVLALPSFALGQDPSLANYGKSGLYVRSIDQVLRLPEDQIDLATAALIISEYWSDLVHGRRYLQQLDEMALEIQARLRKLHLKPNYRAIPVINDYLFNELGFRSVAEASDPNELFLHTVLEKRHGYCLSLSILYLSLAERLGLPLYGVVVPGHFFVRYDDKHVRFNIETTSKGGTAPDEHYIRKFNVPTDQPETIYLKNLTKRQTLGCFFNNLGNSYIDVGNYDAALEALLNAVQINPNLAESRSNLANLYLRQHRLNDAIYQYRISLEINPADPKTHNNLGNAYIEKNWYNYAISEYLLAINLDPNFVDPYRNLAIVYCKQHRFDQALAQLRQALALQGDDPDCHLQMADTYRLAGKCLQAIEYYKTALKLKPTLAEAHYGLALCYNRLGRTDLEIACYRSALAIKPRMLAALVNLGNAYFQQENYDRAIQHYLRAIKVDPNDADIYCNLGAAYSNIGSCNRAMVAYRHAIKLDPKAGPAYYGLAICYYQLADYKLALQYIQTARKLGVEVPTDQYELIRRKAR